jgi:hypothetical protein
VLLRQRQRLQRLLRLRRLRLRRLRLRLRLRLWLRLRRLRLRLWRQRRLLLRRPVHECVLALQPLLQLQVHRVAKLSCVEVFRGHVLCAPL